MKISQQKREILLTSIDHERINEDAIDTWDEIGDEEAVGSNDNE